MFGTVVNQKDFKWHQFYLNLAEQYASLSRDPRLQVGSVIVNDEFTKLVGAGYNGWEKGGTNIPDSLEPGQSGAIHSELNAMLSVDAKKLYPNCILYVTHFPCKICCRCIVNFSTIKKVIYKSEYRDLSGLDILVKAGIVVYNLKDNKIRRIK